jgi:hypothetical protein
MKLFHISLLFIPAISAFGQSKQNADVRAKDAIRAAHQAPSDEARQNAYKSIGENSILDDADVEALHAELKFLAKDIKDAAQGKSHVASAQILASRLERSSAPKYYPVIKRLLEDDADHTPSSFMGHWGTNSEAGAARDAVVYERLQALANAAGAGQNESALPALRKMRRKGGDAGKLAEKAIGQIGSDEDLEEMIRELKTNPRSRANPGVFGSRGLRRMAKDLRDPNISRHDKSSLLGAFPKFAAKEDFPTLVDLLQHEEPDVSGVASEALRNSVTSEDASVIRTMLANKNRRVQGEALIAINGHWDRKYLPDVIHALKKAPDDWSRAYAAKILGDNNVSEAASDLKVAAEKDAVANVRQSAQYALSRIK